MKYWSCYLKMKFATFATKLNSEFDARISRRRLYLINLIFIQKTVFWKIVRAFFICDKLFRFFLSMKITFNRLTQIHNNESSRSKKFQCCNHKIQNSSTYVQRQIDQLLREQKKYVRVYVNDIVIFFNIKKNTKFFPSSCFRNIKI